MKDSLQLWIKDRKEKLGKEKGEIKAVLVGTRRTDPHGSKSRQLYLLYLKGYCELM